MVARRRQRVQGRQGHLGDLPDALTAERIGMPPISARIMPGARSGGTGRAPLDPIGYHGQRMMNYRHLAQTETQRIFPTNPYRCYLLIVNRGTQEVRIGVGRSASLTDGLPLDAAGGFWEPILGTVDSVHSITTVADQELIIIEGFYVPPPS